MLNLKISHNFLHLLEHAKLQQQSATMNDRKKYLMELILFCMSLIVTNSVFKKILKEKGIYLKEPT